MYITGKNQLAFSKRQYCEILYFLQKVLATFSKTCYTKIIIFNNSEKSDNYDQ